MKIYTKKGDQGDTSLFGGDRVSKSSERIEAYGTVDELNSWLGLALSFGLSERGTEIMTTVQEHLFILGADLATPSSERTRIERIGEDQVKSLEHAIDRMEEELPELKNFILPGGSKSGAHLHVARTICRRAERAVVRCGMDEEISEFAIKYLNRLSDLLFVVARFENHRDGNHETRWKPERNDKK
ncbi:cob(I)yrinic acid a,c-diamide adenosyltransferase [Aliifodinibius sp. S!AR15-10]|uniref:cob(I)yrinic acid a,c-diamide adenosyltransferase n=1 Tax=Aliifodinibius sp. S!AR15-10 TaxID=2950437 RepID=UPI002860575D|nr:cob(I)yrinic acid a,c-diamide adenosyltransferase [Aliifodinibius sp. S!AR15-10]MDR8391744.1 cob(I)yrinic acid a,c-diamide adenosyltransferase [Aliifodinibius sp. S!AR15-10]